MWGWELSLHKLQAAAHQAANIIQQQHIPSSTTALSQLCHHHCASSSISFHHHTHFSIPPFSPPLHCTPIACTALETAVCHIVFLFISFNFPPNSFTCKYSLQRVVGLVQSFWFLTHQKYFTIAKTCLGYPIRVRVILWPGRATGARFCVSSR